MVDDEVVSGWQWMYILNNRQSSLNQICKWKVMAEMESQSSLWIATDQLQHNQRQLLSTTKPKRKESTLSARLTPNREKSYQCTFQLYLWLICDLKQKIRKSLKMTYMRACDVASDENSNKTRKRSFDQRAPPNHRESLECQMLLEDDIQKVIQAKLDYYNVAAILKSYISF